MVATLSSESESPTLATVSEDASATEASITGPYTIDGNTLTLIVEGPDRMAQMLGLIGSAERTLRVIYYIYVADDAGTTIRDALIAAAKRGVAVSMIIDGLGSELAARADFFQPLRDAGVHFCRFVPRLGRRYLLRNHQKLLLADESRAIIGGFNIEDSYFGTAEDGAWRDLGLLIEGDAATRLAPYFDALSVWAERPSASLKRLGALLRQSSETQGALRWVFGGPMRRQSPWARAIKEDIARAHSTDLIAPYFAPSPIMFRRLIKGARRGQTRLVLPAKLDHTSAIWAARFTYRGLLRKGVQIYEYLPTKLHTKLFIVDDVTYIGSANFDIRSMYLNLEMMLRIEDAGFAAYMRRYFVGEMAGSERITRALHRERTTLWIRIKQMAAYFVMGVVDYKVTRRLNFGPSRRR